MPQFLDGVSSYLKSKEDKENIVFIISDGRINKEKVKQKLHLIKDQEIQFYFIILDSKDE